MGGRAVLLVENTVYEHIQIISRAKKKAAMLTVESFNDLSDDDSEADKDDVIDTIVQTREAEEGVTWRFKKKVEPGLRAWIETTQCRRLVANKYFASPPRS